MTAYYGGEYIASPPIYRYAYGYEWAVTFLSVMAYSPDTKLSVCGDDCKYGTYVTDLSAWSQYYLRLVDHNLRGFGDYAAFMNQTPQAIPAHPRSLILDVLSDSSVDAFFMPPVTASGVITNFTIQLDSDTNF